MAVSEFAWEARGAGWLNKAQALRGLSPGASEADSERKGERSARRSNAVRVIGQKSAEAIVAAELLTRKAAAKGRT